MARLEDKLVGHRERLTPLLEAHQKGRLASALLFAGPSGVGKRLAAHVLAQTLVCEKAELHACGSCGPCSRVEKGQSESLLEVQPDGAGIKIEQARDILQFIGLRKLGRARIVIIDQAQLMNPQTANALLKSLEEPPDGTYFILVTPVAGSMMATIRSRTQLVRFGPLSDQELEKVLGSEQGSDPWVIASAHGSVEAAERLLESREDFKELEEALGAYLIACGQRFPIEESARLKDLTKDRASQGFVAGWIEGVIRDGLRVQAGMKPVSPKLWEKAAATFGRFNNDQLSDLASDAFQMEYEMARNVDRGLLLENFALKLNGAAGNS